MSETNLTAEYYPGKIRGMDDVPTYSAFLGDSMLAFGQRDRVLTLLKAAFDKDPGAPVLIFEDRTGKQVDFDLRGSLAEILARHAPAPARVGPGRPKLGVVAREISLLPRHWEWLERQASGASAAIRRLVDEARKRNPAAEESRARIDATARFLSAMAGNLSGYEEAIRALYARDQARFHRLMRTWPRDIRAHARRLTRQGLQA
jgi:hypothetical protein